MNNKKDIELLKEIIKDKTLDELNEIKINNSNLSRYFYINYGINLKHYLIIRLIYKEKDAELVVRTVSNTKQNKKKTCRHYVFEKKINTSVEKFKEMLNNTTIESINYTKKKYPDLSYFYRERGINLTHKQIVKIIKEKYGVELVQKRIDDNLHNLFVDKNLVKQKPKSGASYHFEKWLIEHKEKYDIETLNAMKLNGSLSKHFSQIDDEFKDLGDIIITKTIKRIYNVKTIRRRIDGIRHYVFVENEEK